MLRTCDGSFRSLPGSGGLILLGLGLVLGVSCGQEPGDDSPVCGNGLREPTEVCEGADLGGASCVALGYASGTLRCSETCQLDPGLCVPTATCGDGVRAGDEQCDDGNRSDCDGCSVDCREEACGNGIRECEEVCDDGNTVGGDGCAADCASDESCGNGLLDPGEGCDHGLANSDIIPNACRADCLDARCGDGVVDSGELCDDGAGNSDTQPNACRTGCTPPSCGDDVVDAGEVCDDGNQLSGDGCAPDCQSDETCGNGVVDPAEGCDDGLSNSDVAADACRTDCVPPSCGDGVVDSGELCDDGASNSDALPDACRTGCVPAGCGDGVVDAGELCDDGTGNSDVVPDACRTDCAPARCGDGVTDSTEVCDGSSLPAQDCAGLGYFTGVLFCSPVCDYDDSGCSDCGNGIIDAGEACDGSDVGGTACGDISPHPDGAVGCSATCTLDASACHTCGDGVVQGAEPCDGTDLAGADCSPFGYANGTPSCSSSCELEATGCFAICGDGTQEPGEECDDGNLTDWDGCNSCAVAEFQINTTTLGNQWRADVALNASGTAVVVWDSGHLGGGSYAEVMGQRIAASGQDLGNELLINTTLSSWQIWPRIGLASDDRFFVAWESYHQDDGVSFAIISRQYGANGLPVGGEQQVNTYIADDQNRPVVGVNSTGAGVVVWHSEDQDGNADGVFGRRLSSSFGFASGEFQVNSTTLWSQRNADVAVAANGDFVVVWQSDWQDGDYWGVYGRRYSANGVPLGGEFHIAQTTLGVQHFPVIAMAADGAFVVVWLDYTQANWIHPIGVLRARRFASDGSALGPEFAVSSNIFGGPSGRADVAMADDGSFVVVWEGNGNPAFTCCIFRRRFISDGSPAEDDVLLRQQSTSLSEPRVAMAPDGRFMMVWEWDELDGSGSTVVGQRFTADGIAIGRAPW